MQTNNSVILFGVEQAAQYIGLSASTLAKMRMRGDGPAYVKLGNHAVRYRRADLDAYISASVRRSTSESPEDI